MAGPHSPLPTGLPRMWAACPGLEQFQTESGPVAFAAALNVPDAFCFA